MIKKIISLIPSISIAIIISSTIKLTFYYLGFDIPIYQFLGLSEIGLLFTNDLIIFGGSVFTVVTLMLLVINIRFPISEKPKSLNKLTLIEKILNAILVILVCVLLLAAIFTNKYQDKLIYISGVIFLGSFMLFSIGYKRNKDLAKKYKNEVMIYFCGTVFLAIIMFSVSLEYDSVINGRYASTKIITSDTTYTSNENSFYIGRTSSYTFIHNRKDSTNTIIPNESIKSFVLKLNPVTKYKY